MKKMYFAMATVLGLALTSCSGEDKTEQVDVTFNLDTDATSLKWTGKYVADGHTHTGTVNVTEGTVVYSDDELVSAKFTIDMSTIVCTDLEGEKNGYLVGHLKSEDFFNIEKFSKIEVEATNINETEIVANIKLLGKEVKALMPVKVSRSEETLTAIGTFEIDFADLNLGGFKAAEGDPEDQKTSSVISFDLNLVLKK
jgi:polyisoprenoid-binding protein YceI